MHPSDPKVIVLGHHSFVNNEIGDNLGPFVIKLSKYSKYTSLLKNSIAFFDVPNWRIFLMKDLAAVEEGCEDGCREVPERL